MRHYPGVLCAVIGLTAALGSAEQPAMQLLEKRFGGPVVRVPQPRTPPLLDGDLTEAVWQEATPVLLGHANGAWWDKPSQKTEARILADEKALYFAVRCFESEPERLVPSGDLRKGMILKADAVEFFLDPGHGEQRFGYFHVIVTQGGTIYTARGLEPDGWKGAVTAKVGKFDGGWTVEAAVPLQELGLKAGGIPKVWGLNVCRQRPELAFDMPQAARAAGNTRYDPPMWKLDEPEKYRLAEYTCWSPTLAEFSGWPFYADSRPFHYAERFGHALLEVGTQEVKPPAKVFEVLFQSDFDDGKLDGFKHGVLVDDNFRGPGKALTFADGQNTLALTQPLADLDDVTLLFALKLKEQRLPVQHLSLTALAPDGIWCGAERYEFFLTPAEAESRTKFLQDYHTEKYGAGPFALYDTHADMVRWKPCGRVRPGPGPWAMVEGYFAEPSGGQVRWPGQDWVIVRIRLSVFRRAPQPKQGQRLVPREQNYPNGLLLRANPRDGLRIDDLVIFRGADVEPPAPVAGIQLERQGDEVTVTWNKSRDNTLTAFYRLYAGEKLLLETHRLSAQVPAASVTEATLRLVAVDLYGNASAPAGLRKP